MKQYKITTELLNYDSSDDCYLAPDDPVHNLKPASMLGGLGSESAIAQYNNASIPVVLGSDKGRIQREQNIKPGTDQWFALWYGGRNT
jgi:hypothetical protein